MSYNRTPVGLEAYEAQLSAQKKQFERFQAESALEFVACQAYRIVPSAAQQTWLKQLAGKQESVIVGVLPVSTKSKDKAKPELVEPLHCLQVQEPLADDGSQGLVWLPTSLSDDARKRIALTDGQAVQRVELKPTRQPLRWYLKRASLLELAPSHWQQFQEILRQYVQSPQYFPLTRELKSRTPNPMDHEWEGNFEALLELKREALPKVEFASLYIRPIDAQHKANLRPQHTLYPSINTYELDMQLRALQQLRNPKKLAHQRLQALFRPPLDVDELLRALYRLDEAAAEPHWRVLTDAKRDGTAQQRLFVQKALQTPDFAVLEGPPGSGKTTAIHELILQLLARGKRVLLVSATHVAIDNVLEKLLVPHQQGELLACRISSSPTAIAHAEVRNQLWMPNLVKRIAEATQRHLRRLPAQSPGQQLLDTALNRVEDDFEDFVIQQADVVAGTMVGILQHPSFRNPRPTSRPFDYLIVDEASKVTVSSFLVPALRAERWVLVGDTQQLAPYCDSLSLLPYLSQITGLDTEKSAEVFGYLEQLFAYRMLPGFVDGTRRKLDDAIRGLSDQQKEALEQFRRVAFPSILDALQHGTALEGIGSWADESLLAQGFAAIDPTNYDGWHARFESLMYQSRMADEIAQWARQLFYGNQNLHTANVVELRPNPLRDYGLGPQPEDLVVWRRLRPTSPKPGNTNPDEAQAVLRELEALRAYAQKRGLESLSVAVLTFYRGQEKLLKRKLKPILDTKSGLKVTLCTVDRFQGQEADVVLLCFTKWGGRPFYNVPNRLNVAITRARHKLILLGAPSQMHGQGFTHAIRTLASIDPLADLPPDNSASPPLG